MKENYRKKNYQFFTAKTQKESNRQVFFSKIWQMCVFGKITAKLFLKTSYWRHIQNRFAKIVNGY